MAVIDASCLAKRFLDQAGHQELRAWFDAEISRGGPIEAPSVVRYELGRILQRHQPGRRAEAQAETLFRTLRRVAILDPPSVEVFRVSKRGLTFFDASYVALALERRAPLVTADAEMARVARTLRVRTLML